MKKKKLLIGFFGLTLPGVFFISVLGLVLFSNHSTTESTSTGGCSIVGKYDSKQIDIVLEKAGAFAGKREVFERVAKKHNIDPILMIAICIHETGWGKSVAVRDYNNPSGQMTSGGLIKFPTLEEGLEMTGRTLDNLMNERQLNTIEKLQTAYAPSGASNDPTGLNNFWVKNVTSFADELGGVNGTSICTTPSNATGKAKKMLDWANSLHEKGVIYTQGGNRGTFPYHDCSSFVTTAMKEAGIKIGLGSTETLYQVEGTLLEPISKKEVKAGDIFVWGVKGGSGGDFGHTGIFLDNGKNIIHCTPATERGFGQKGDVVKTPFDGYYGSPEQAPVYFYRVK